MLRERKGQVSKLVPKDIVEVWWITLYVWLPCLTCIAYICMYTHNGYK